MALPRGFRNPLAAAVALLVVSSAAPAVYCLRELSGLGRHIARSTEAEAQAKQARRVVDESDQSITSYAAVALDLTEEERDKVFQDTDRHLEQLRRLFPPLEPLARQVLSVEDWARLQDAVSSLVHNWGEIREQAGTGVADAEKTFHFLKVFDDTLLIRSLLARIEEAATRAAEEGRTDSLESLEAAGRSFAVAVSGGGALGLLASLCVHLSSRSTRRANAELTRANLGLQQRDARFQAALDNMTQGLCLFDAHGRLVVHNPCFAAMFGALAPGTPAAALGPALGAEGLFAPPDPARPGGQDAGAHELADGRTIQVSRRAVPGGGWVATYEDVTERRRTQERLSHMARHDALTGLPNRVLLREHMDRVLARLRRGGAAVLCLDLDGFKGVNDTLGHPVGDELLRLVARRLKGCLREVDFVARLGGDEFAVVQADADQPADAAGLAERLVEALRAPFYLRGQRIAIGTSVGVALAAGAGAVADELLRGADVALYRAKAAGRGTWRVFESGMDDEMRARGALEADLRRALAEGQFEPFYQPLVDARTRAPTGFEALLRWRHPARGLVSPGEFIPVAEEIGLIRPLGAWVLARACADAANWPEHVRVAVNLSPAQFVEGDLVREVERALAASGLPAHRLELEVTESVLLQEDAATLGVLHRLRASGVRVAMDDFGTGYSSLSYLRRFPFDKIKVDQSFVRDLGRDGDGVEIVRAVVHLGKALGMAVLAEGVETEEQADILRAEGCDELQGYLFGKPRPGRDVPEVAAGHLAAETGPTPGPTLVVDGTGGGLTAA